MESWLSAPQRTSISCAQHPSACSRDHACATPRCDLRNSFYMLLECWLELWVNSNKIELGALYAGIQESALSGFRRGVFWC